MTQEQIDECFDLLQQYNPDNERISERDYIKLKVAFYNGDDIALEKFRLLTFYRGGERLLEEYIAHNRAYQNFQDDLHNVFLLTQEMVPSWIDFESYELDVAKSVQNHLFNQAKNEKRKNIYLNYDWEDFDAQEVGLRLFANDQGEFVCEIRQK